MGQSLRTGRTQVEPISRIERPLAVELSNTREFAKRIHNSAKITHLQAASLEKQLEVISILLRRKDDIGVLQELSEARAKSGQIRETLHNIETAAEMIVVGTTRVAARTVVE